MKNKFKDYNIRIWDDGDISIDSNDLDFCAYSSFVGVQTNSLDENVNSEIIEICKQVHKELIKLTNKLSGIK